MSDILGTIGLVIAFITTGLWLALSVGYMLPPWWRRGEIRLDGGWWGIGAAAMFMTLLLLKLVRG